MGGEMSSCLLCFEGDNGPYADSHRYTCFEDLQLDKELGHGAFSTVRLALNRKNKDKFAVKVVHKTKLSKQDIEAPRRRGIMREDGTFRRRFFDARRATAVTFQLVHF